jgi:ABC-type multidrug transport system fused ATPase/permease subunit
MASKISKEMVVMKRGMGEKVASIFQAVFGFFLSLAFAFYWGWLLALIICGTLPIIGILVGGMAAAFNTGSVEAMKAYA